MAKPEWGTKRICLSCGARFYDMQRDPVVCPACGTPHDPLAQAKPRRTRAAAPKLVAVPEEAPEIEAGGADEDVEVEEEEDLEVEEDDEAEAGKDEAEDDEDEEADSAIEDVSELGDDDEDVSDVIDADIDEDERGR